MHQAQCRRLQEMHEGVYVRLVDSNEFYQVDAGNKGFRIPQQIGLERNGHHKVGFLAE